MIYYPQSTAEKKGLAAWAVQRLRDVDRLDGAFEALAVVRDDEIQAVAIYNDYARCEGGGNMSITFATESPRWASPDAVAAILAYPFVTAGVHRLNMICHVKNKRIRKLVEGLGFIQEGSLRRYFWPHNALIYGMTREDWEKSPWSKRASVPKPDVPLGAIRAAA